MMKKRAKRTVNGMVVSLGIAVFLLPSVSAEEGIPDGEWPFSCHEDLCTPCAVPGFIVGFGSPLVGVPLVDGLLVAADDQKLTTLGLFQTMGTYGGMHLYQIISGASLHYDLCGVGGCMSVGKYRCWLW